jgi:ABC-type amino acid transport substrate-binding protein
VVLVALVGAGCGGGQPADTGAQRGGTQLEGLVTGGLPTVGTELPAAPFWIGDDYDSLTGGFEVDLAKEIARRLGLGGTRFVAMPFTGLVAGQQCPCDIDFSQVTITPDRAKVVKFTEPCFDANQGILVKEGTRVTGLADARHLRWGAQLNTTGADYLAHTIKPTTETRLFDRTVDAFTALNTGQIQAVLLDTPIVLGAVKERRVRQGRVVGQFRTGEQYGAVVNRDSPNLDAFNQVITSLKSEGFVDRLLQTYFKDQVSVPVIG